MSNKSNSINISVSDSKKVNFGDVSLHDNSTDTQSEKDELLVKLREAVANQGEEIETVVQAFEMELQKDKPQPSLLKILWNGLESSVPAVHFSADILRKVAKFIE